MRAARTSYASLICTKYADASGKLPSADLPAVVVKNRSAAGARGVAFTRATLELDAAAAVTLRPGDVRGLRAWVAGEPVDLAGGSAAVDLPAGRHEVVLAVDGSPGRTGLKLVSDGGRWLRPGEGR